MKKTRSLLLTALAGLLALLLFNGCSDSDGTQVIDPAAQTGRVNVYLTGQTADRSLPGVNTKLSLLFDEIALIAPGVDEDATIPSDWELPGVGETPQCPIPVLDRPTMLNLLAGLIPTPGEQGLDAIEAMVPAGSYNKIRLVLDEASNPLALASGLKFDSATAIIPIIGGLQVDPGESIDLLVNLYTSEAEVLED